MLGPIIAGVVLGLIAFLPTFFMTKQARKIIVSNNVGSVGMLLLSFVLSFLIMLIGVLVCDRICADGVLIFSLSMVVTLSVAAIAFGIKNARK